MKTRLSKTKLKRFLAFILDFYFIIFLAFSINGLIGVFLRIDSDFYQNIMMYILFIIIIPYLFFGELIFNNSLGKYLLGIEVSKPDTYSRPNIGSFIKRGLLKIIWPLEGLILLFSKNKKRLGDYWGKTIVVNKKTNKYTPLVRISIGIIISISVYYGSSFFMGLGVKNTDSYNIANNYLSEKGILIDGLPKEMNQFGEVINLVVPITDSIGNEYALIYLEKVKDEWSVYHSEFMTEHSGSSFTFDISSYKKQEFFKNDTLSFEGIILETGKEGTCKWYHENGNLKEVTIWHNGVAQGKVLMFHKNGKLSATATMVNGIKEGEAKVWYEGGQISEKLFYKNNEISGEYTSYHSNGQIEEQGIYESSIRKGEWIKYTENGERIN